MDIKNIEIFKNNSLQDAILSDDLFGNRTPLIYIVNDILNPFFTNMKNTEQLYFYSH